MAALFLALAVLLRRLSLAAELRRGARAYAALGVPAATVPILIPCYSRPQYLSRVLDSLRANAHINEVRARSLRPPPAPARPT